MTRERIRGLPSVTGIGKLLCNECGEPLRDHRIGFPCPHLILPVGARLTVGRPARYERGDPESPAAKRKRASREKKK